MNRANDLNRLYDKYFSTDLSPLVPLKELNASSNISIEDNNGQTVLKPLALSPLVEVNNPNPDNRAVTYRNVISYSDYSKMESNDTVFIFKMSQVLNRGLKEIVDLLGNLKGRKVSFTGFFDAKEHSGYEFRIYVSKSS